MLVLFAELLAGLQVTPALLLALAYFSINLASLFALSAITPNPDTAWERGKIFAYFSTPDLAAHSIVNYSSWGAYSIPALYAPPDALVIYIEPLNASSVAKLYEVSQRTHRQIFDICLGENCTAEKLADSFGHRLRFRELQLGLNDWHVFAGESP